MIEQYYTGLDHHAGPAMSGGLAPIMPPPRQTGLTRAMTFQGHDVLFPRVCEPNCWSVRRVTAQPLEGAVREMGFPSSSWDEGNLRYPRHHGSSVQAGLVLSRGCWEMGDEPSSSQMSKSRPVHDLCETAEPRRVGYCNLAGM